MTGQLLPLELKDSKDFKVRDVFQTGYDNTEMRILTMPVHLAEGEIGIHADYLPSNYITGTDPNQDYDQDLTLGDYALMAIGVGWGFFYYQNYNRAYPTIDGTHFQMIYFFMLDFECGLKGQPLRWLDSSDASTLDLDAGVGGIGGADNSAIDKEKKAYQIFRRRIYMEGLRWRKKYPKLADIYTTANYTSYLRTLHWYTALAMITVGISYFMPPTNTARAFMSILANLETLLSKKIDPTTWLSSVDEHWKTMGRKAKGSYIGTNITNHKQALLHYFDVDELDASDWDPYIQKFNRWYRVPNESLWMRKMFGLAKYTDGETTHNVFQACIIAKHDAVSGADDPIAIGETLAAIMSLFEDIRPLERDINQLLKQAHFTFAPLSNLKWIDFSISKSTNGWAEADSYIGFKRHFPTTTAKTSTRYYFSTAISPLEADDFINLSAKTYRSGATINHPSQPWFHLLLTTENPTDPNANLWLGNHMTLANVTYDMLLGICYDILEDDDDHTLLEGEVFWSSFIGVDVYNFENETVLLDAIMCTINSIEEIRFESIGNVLNSTYTTAERYAMRYHTRIDNTQNSILSASRLKGFKGSSMKWIPFFGDWSVKVQIFDLMIGVLGEVAPENPSGTPNSPPGPNAPGNASNPTPPDHSAG